MSLLGQNTPVPEHYAPELLDPISRDRGRRQLQDIADFYGVDIWHVWELSWLDARGMPRLGVGRLQVPADSHNLVESKSLKLYFNSLNQARFETKAALQKTVIEDISAAAGKRVQLDILDLSAALLQPGLPPGECIDDAGTVALAGAPDRNVLQYDAAEGVQQLHSHLLRSLCPVTGQPDWASVLIEVEGVRLEQRALLAYLLGFRRHQAFHEQCVEQIFSDIWHSARPRRLSVYAAYTRRGGLDINPWRSSVAAPAPTLRLARQ